MLKKNRNKMSQKDTRSFGTITKTGSNSAKRMSFQSHFSHWEIIRQRKKPSKTIIIFRKHSQILCSTRKASKIISILFSRLFLSMAAQTHKFVPRHFAQGYQWFFFSWLLIPLDLLLSIEYSFSKSASVHPNTSCLFLLYRLMRFQKEAEKFDIVWTGN